MSMSPPDTVHAISTWPWREHNYADEEREGREERMENMNEPGEVMEVDTDARLTRGHGDQLHRMSALLLEFFGNVRC